MGVAALAVATGVLVPLGLVSNAAAGSPAKPQQRHTAADMRLAQSISLQRSDLPPGWHASTSADVAAAPCASGPDESALVETALVRRAFTFSDGTTTVGSEIAVFRSTREAEIDWRASTLHPVASCVASALARLAKGPTTGATFERLAQPGLSERTVHYRITMSVLGAQPVFDDVVAFGAGRVTTSFQTITVGEPFPDHVTRVYAVLLADRLNAARVSR